MGCASRVITPRLRAVNPSRFGRDVGGRRCGRHLLNRLHRNHLAASAMTATITRHSPATAASTTNFIATMIGMPKNVFQAIQDGTRVSIVTHGSTWITAGPGMTARWPQVTLATARPAGKDIAQESPDGRSDGMTTVSTRVAIAHVMTTDIGIRIAATRSSRAATAC